LSAATTPPGDNRESERVFGFLVSRNPLIYWGPVSPPHALAGPGTTLAERIGNRRAYFLIRTIWTHELESYFSDEQAHLAALRDRYPEHRHIFLCNTRVELQLMKNAGIPAILCSSLVYIDETIFNIMPDEQKEFDAVYNAGLVRFKRHELCRDVHSLALLYHQHHPEHLHEPDYPKQLRTKLPHANFINDADGRYRHLSPQEVACWTNRARVGLCLSAAEGAMRVTAEYLLCGLPVVSTPSIGGRDRVLHPAWSRIVDPTPEAVAAAVADMASRLLDPHQIRRGVFELLRPDRIRLVKLIAAIYQAEGTTFPEQAPWNQLFRRGTWPEQSVDTALDEAPLAEQLASGLDDWR
jgi:hypothetical protein